MKIVGVDTSTSHGSVSIMEDGRVVDSVSSTEGESFSRSLLSMINQLLIRNSTALKNVDAFGVAIGPGSFTGIRIGIASLKGISLALKIPIYAVSTLEAMVHRQQQVNDNLPPTISPLIDAGRGKVYTAVFSISGKNKISRLLEDRKIAYSCLKEENKKRGCFFGELPKWLNEEQKTIYNSDGIKYDAVLSAGVAQILYAGMEGGELMPSAVLAPNYLNRGPVKN